MSETTFGLVQFKELRQRVASMTGDNVPADVWCEIDDFIDTFCHAGKVDPILECEGTMDFFARLYCICAYIWNENTINNEPVDSKEYALRTLDEAIKDLEV